MTVKRIYVWSMAVDDRGNCLQIRLQRCTDAWEPLASSARDVGPFDDTRRIRAELRALVDDLADGQIPGQLQFD